MTPQGRAEGESHTRRGIQTTRPAELNGLGDKPVAGCLQVSLRFRSSLPYPAAPDHAESSEAPLHLLDTQRWLACPLSSSLNGLEDRWAPYPAPIHSAVPTAPTHLGAQPPSQIFVQLKDSRAALLTHNRHREEASQ